MLRKTSSAKHKSSHPEETVNITTEQYCPGVISETEAKVITIWRLFTRLQEIGDNRDNCNLELSDSGYGFIRHYSSDVLYFPDGSDIVDWKTFDDGIQVLSKYLKFMETYNSDI